MSSDEPGSVDPDETDAAKREYFFSRVQAGHRYALDRWVNAEEHLVLSDVFELGAAFFDQGLDGANEVAAQIQSAQPALRHRS